jgi:hypothetical protein
MPTTEARPGSGDDARLYQHQQIWRTRVSKPRQLLRRALEELLDFRIVFLSFDCFVPLLFATNLDLDSVHAHSRRIADGLTFACHFWIRFISWFRC